MLNCLQQVACREEGHLLNCVLFLCDCPCSPSFADLWTSLAMADAAAAHDAAVGDKHARANEADGAHLDYDKASQILQEILPFLRSSSAGSLSTEARFELLLHQWATDADIAPPAALCATYAKTSRLQRSRLKKELSKVWSLVKDSDGDERSDLKIVIKKLVTAKGRAALVRQYGAHVETTSRSGSSLQSKLSYHLFWTAIQKRLISILLYITKGQNACSVCCGQPRHACAERGGAVAQHICRPSGRAAVQSILSRLVDRARRNLQHLVQPVRAEPRCVQLLQEHDKALA